MREYIIMARVNGIDDIDELKKAAGAQGASVADYNKWEEILKDFEELGVQSTGSYQGDLSLHNQMKIEAEQYAEDMKVEQAKEVQQTQQQQPENMVKSDNEQALKATVANGVSSDIMANYMKVFHMI